jgi:hypothetical protein
MGIAGYGLQTKTLGMIKNSYNDGIEVPNHCQISGVGKENN